MPNLLLERPDRLLEAAVEESGAIPGPCDWAADKELDGGGYAHLECVGSWVGGFLHSENIQNLL